MKPFRVRLLQFSFLLGGMLWSFSGGVKADTSPDDLRVGFYLLRDVCHEETQVHLITMVKTTPADVTDFVNRVSKTASESLASVDEMEDRNAALKLEKNPLPLFEQNVRSTIRADKQHQLLFGTKDAAFARALLVTQIEAVNYILNIAKVLADEDPSSRDTRTLLRMSSRWTKLRDEAFRLLAR